MRTDRDINLCAKIWWNNLTPDERKKYAKEQLLKRGVDLRNWSTYGIFSRDIIELYKIHNEEF